MNLHTKFDVSSSDHSRHMEGFQNFKSRLRDPFQPPST